VPYRRNPHFTGQEELLAQLDLQLAGARGQHPTAAHRAALTQPQALKGLGGIGKTQIALEYAYRACERGCYLRILWINTASEEALISRFVGLADLLPALSAERQVPQHRRVEAVKRWLGQCPEPWLLIFDNADDISLLRRYLPRRGNGSVLLTTRSHAIGALATALAVERTGLVEGTLLLLRRARRQEASEDKRNEAANIVIALDGFPLALDQAGAYIEETGCSFTDYLQV
jgi:hypothetical protein